MIENKIKNRYCCVIVTYNRAPDLTVINRAMDSRLVDGLIISDNSNDPYIIKGIRNQFDSRFQDKYVIIENHENLGISRAMSIAMKKGLELGFEFAFLLDDDAQLSDDYFELMLDTMEKYKRDDKKIAAVCPTLSNNPKHLSKIIKRRKTDIIKQCITSGMLIDIMIAVSLGGYSEKYFLEYADIEFTNRLYNSGYKILRYNKVMIYQQLGKNIESIASRVLYFPMYCINILKFNLNLGNNIMYFMPLYDPNRTINIDKARVKFMKQITRSKIRLLYHPITLLYKHTVLYFLTGNQQYLKISFRYIYEVK